MGWTVFSGQKIVCQSKKYRHSGQGCQIPGMGKTYPNRVIQHPLPHFPRKVSRRFSCFFNSSANMIVDNINNIGGSFYGYDEL